MSCLHTLDIVHACHPAVVVSEDINDQMIESIDIETWYAKPSHWRDSSSTHEAELLPRLWPSTRMQQEEHRLQWHILDNGKSIF